MKGHNETTRTQESAACNKWMPKQEAEVVIIGAGLAGLAAAQRLHELGLKDIIILEALERIGGRVHTVSHSNYLIELGAQWLHGADDNPLCHWLADKDMLDDFEDASIGFEGIFCSSSGVKIDHNLVRRVIDLLVDVKLSMSKKQLDDVITENGFTLASEVFAHMLENHMKIEPQLERNRCLVKSVFNWFLKYETIENGCDDMSEVSITSYTDWTDSGDGTLLNFKRGYRSLLLWFTDNIPASEWINLNKPVLNIELLTRAEGANCHLDTTGSRHNRPVLVKYTDANAETSKSYIINCNHVIVTASLGYLKKNHSTLFIPPLSRSKIDLISSIGFGTVNKIILEFESPFWSEKGIKLVWTDEKESGHLPTWSRDIISFDTVRRQPKLLIGWVGGKGAKCMECEDDKLIADTCIQILNKFLPSDHKRPTKLINCICSRWNSNPFICGSYSFQSSNSFKMNIDKLHEPVFDRTPDCVSASICEIGAPRIMFAGEATSGKLYSTSHGAITSGWREADRLAEYLSKIN